MSLIYPISGGSATPQMFGDAVDQADRDSGGGAGQIFGGDRPEHGRGRPAQRDRHDEEGIRGGLVSAIDGSDQERSRPQARGAQVERCARRNDRNGGR